MLRLILATFLILTLPSCAAKYACKDRVDIEGERCDPITTVYEKKMLGKDDGLVEKKEKQKEEAKVSPPEDVAAVRSLRLEEEKPLRLPPRVIRIWIAPWEDADGDLHQPSYIYSEISPKRGRWLFGEKEVVTTQPILRPMEKPSEDLEKNGKEKKETSGKREDDKKERKGSKEALPLPFQPGLRPQK